MVDNKKTNEKQRYKTFSFRLHEKTFKNFKEKKLKSGLSWNRFIYNLITKKNDED